MAVLAVLSLVLAGSPAGAAEVSPVPSVTTVPVRAGSVHRTATSPVTVVSTTAAQRRAAAQVARRRRQAEKAQLRTERIAQRREEQAARLTAQRLARSAVSAPPSTSSVRTEVAGITISAPQPIADPILATPAASGPLSATELQELLERWTASRTDLGAMSVTIRQYGQSWTGSARNGGAAPDPTQRYRSLSVTKTITAALILRQVELGTISLDAPLAPLSAINAPLPPGLTVRHLLRHRTGLVDYNAAPGYVATAPLSPRAAVELSLRAPLRAPVDSATSYTNSNYLYLGLLLEQTTGRPYGDLVGELVASIGMASTRLEPPDRAGWPGFSSGGVMSTTADLAMWGEALTTPGRVLRESSLREMERFDENNAGLGLWTYCPCPRSGEATTFGHHTATGGLFIAPSRGLVIAMRADVEVGDTAGRARALIEAIEAQRSTR